MSELMNRIFTEAMTPTEYLVWSSFIKDVFDKDASERAAAAVLVDWYQRDRTAIVNRLKENAKTTFADDETNGWQYPIINPVPRIIKRIALSYKSPPIRKYMAGDKEINDKVKAKINAMYKNVDQNKKMKTADRWSKLLNTLHMEVVWRNGAIDWDFLLRPAVTVIPDPQDYLNFARLIYEWNVLDPDTLRAESGWIVWDAERYVFVTAKGREIGIYDEDGLNPYDGRVPIVTIRTIECDDYWGRYGSDLVDGTEQANLQWANMWENGFLQTHGQPFGVNLGLEAGAKVKTGPRHFINVEKVTKDMVEPSLTYPKPDPALDEVRQLVERFMSFVSTNYGLPPNAWSMDEVPESGFAKFMNNIELLEDREDFIGQYVESEKELFDVSRMVWNKNTPNAADQIPDDVELVVEFPPVEFVESPTEKQTRYMIMFKNGTSDVVDYFMREENLTEDEAMEKAKTIAKRKKELTSEGSSAFDLPPAIGAKKENDDDGDEGEGGDE